MPALNRYPFLKQHQKRDLKLKQFVFRRQTLTSSPSSKAFPALRAGLSGMAACSCTRRAGRVGLLKTKFGSSFVASRIILWRQVFLANSNLISLIQQQEATRNKCHASSSRCLTSQFRHSGQFRRQLMKCPRESICKVLAHTLNT